MLSTMVSPNLVTPLSGCLFALPTKSAAVARDKQKRSSQGEDSRSGMLSLHCVRGAHWEWIALGIARDCQCPGDEPPLCDQTLLAVPEIGTEVDGFHS